MAATAIQARKWSKQIGRARSRRIGGAVFLRHGSLCQPADGEAEPRRRSDFLQRVLSSQPRVLYRPPGAVRRRHPPGAGLRLRGDGSGDHPRTRLLVSESPTNPHLSVVDVERSRHLAKTRRRNVDRCHARHPLQRSTAGRRRRLRLAFGDQISRRSQRPIGRRHSRRHEKLEPVRTCAASWATSTRRTTSICSSGG